MFEHEKTSKQFHFRNPSLFLIFMQQIHQQKLPAAADTFSVSCQAGKLDFPCAFKSCPSESHFC